MIYVKNMIMSLIGNELFLKKQTKREVEDTFFEKPLGFLGLLFYI